MVSNVSLRFCLFNSFKTADNQPDLELDGDEVDETNFPLPTLSPRLKQFAQSLHNNNGFLLLRGLDSKKYTAEDNLVIFLGISSHIANERGVQDKRGNVVGMIVVGRVTYVDSS